MSALPPGNAGAPQTGGAPPRWQPAPESLGLEPGHVDIWRAVATVPSTTRDTLLEILTAEERRRAARYVVDEPRDTFVVGRAVLRTALARYLACTPGDLVLVTGPHGRPFLAPPHADTQLWFNVSHSAGHIVIAFARDRAVGIDIEHIRDNIDIERLAQRYFAPGESRRLLELPAPERPAAFLRCWTRKEAYLKAHGAGLTFPLDRFEVTLAPHEAPAVLWTEIEDDRPEDWALLDVDTHEGFQTALIVRGDVPIIRTWDAP